MRSKSKAAVLGLLSAGALVVSTASASADTYQVPGQIGSLGTGCWGSYNEIPFASGHHVSGFVYSQQPSGPTCELIEQQWDANDPDFEAEYYANGPGDSISGEALYYGGFICVRLTWLIGDVQQAQQNFC